MAENVIAATVSKTVGDGKRYANYVVSDQHVSAGQWLEIRRARSWRKRAERGGLPGLIQPQPVIRILNPLEDFHQDEAWRDFLRDVVEKDGDADVLNLRLNGDCLDFHSVTWKGKIADPPFEYVAVEKFRTMVRGHPVYFRSLTEFLRHPTAYLIVTAGNHDLHLCWPAVQAEFIRVVSGGDPALAAKIRFVDHAVNFQDFGCGVLYEHGNNAEPHNAVDPKNVIITHHLGKKLDRPILNQPLGSIMTVSLVLPLKMRNGLVGCVPEEPELWKHAAYHRWWWVARAAVITLWTLLHNNLFAFWDWRRKASMAAQIRVVRGSAEKSAIKMVNEYAKKLLKAPFLVDGVPHAVESVCMGHSHGAWRETTPDGTYINTGGWSKRKKIVYPTFEPQWRRLRWLEGKWWAFRHFLTPSHISRLSQFAKLFAFIAGIGGLLAFLATPYTRGERLLSYDPENIKVVAGILLVAFVVIGLFRMLSVKPEIKDDPLLTFALYRHGGDSELRADLKRYASEQERGKRMIDYV